MSSITLPVRVDIRTGAHLPTREDDPREAGVWCIGAADTLDPETRDRYKHKITDLKEKLDVLKSRRKERNVSDE